MFKRSLSFVLFLLLFGEVHAQRVTVLNQIDLPHNYYYRELYLPQLTGGPSSVCWSPDGKWLVYSMAGSLWKQAIDSDTAIQLTDDNGYDYQPDWCPRQNKLAFVRYNGAKVQLMLLDLASGTATPLINNNAVNLEPRWSPDGKSIAYVSTLNMGHFLLYKASVEQDSLQNITCLSPERISKTPRIYYSAYDHAINPVWTKDGKNIICISNEEIIYGTGDIVSINVDSPASRKLLWHEETAWNTRPDVSPDGSRFVYSSYLGRNWHQLWLLPVKGGYPVPLTYGDYDNTNPRWSPDGKSIAFISNRDGNTALWTIDAFDGVQKEIVTKHLLYIKPHINIAVRVVDETGKILPSRISITDSREKFYAPAGAWIQADDARYPALQQYESHYFHSNGICNVTVPKDKIHIRVSHGPAYEITNMEFDAAPMNNNTVVIRLKKIPMPVGFDYGWSGDLHTHMNYCGHYTNTPERFVQQASCEDVNFVFDLIVNKEQRIPGTKYFSPDPDKASTKSTMLLHAQEFHTGYWGHLGILNLTDHLIIPDYAAYAQTAMASLFPNNRAIEDLAHQQHALVGYAHPFEQDEVFPDQSSTLTSELPLDAALGKVDYVELVGFSDHKATEKVWYNILNCGIHLPAGAGTDLMGNYASLRGPVGLNRVFVQQQGKLDRNLFLSDVKQGRSFVTNGPLIGLKVENAKPGDSIILKPGEQTLHYAAFLRCNTAIDSLDLIYNGKVIRHLAMHAGNKSADVKGTIQVNGPGWLVLRAWSPNASSDIPDIYPYASTNPIYLNVPGTTMASKSSAQWLLQWIERLEQLAGKHPSYRNEDEKNEVLKDISDAKAFYTKCLQQATSE